MATGLIKHIPSHLGTTTTTTLLCFISGYRSTCKTSAKAQCVRDYAKQHGYGYMAWDHQPDASVQTWFETSLAMLPQDQPLVLVGASMGTWLALLLAKARPDQVRGIIGVGGAVNNTERWLKEAPTQNENEIWRRPSLYAKEGYYEIPIRMLLDSRKALWSYKEDHVKCPVHLIHGRQDPDAPFSEALLLQQSLSPVATLHVIEDGDHRLSRPQDLKVLETTLDSMMTRIIK
ncbi:alpha beta hydrolase fold protein [Lichtheimia corymbifera JMRC:FSU:9682]|uniref:Palmitoyl-protein thioesterase ABHD10, mitochondrial n=1 Tax=Lichtheimia corymbifera JMRC:FSU:9682 TaxID=1263082 RepID=A0A068SFE4_9FUNG|nr:alpha beta hydrolase fold protein [Lichtheimia corymbifera JMRC:FSU:9682]